MRRWEGVVEVIVFGGLFEKLGKLVIVLGEKMMKVFLVVVEKMVKVVDVFMYLGKKSKGERE